VAIHGPKRGALFLGENPVKHEKLSSRRKDVAKILRKFQRDKGGKISLRITTDFDMAVDKLCAHHKDQNWVTPEVRGTWKYLAGSGKFFIFELWHDEKMIAADFGHVVRGGSFYVATRFFDESAKKLSPGFLLALVETRLLRDAFDIKLWDLGSTDSNPQMAYKAVISNIFSRVAHMHLFRRLQRDAEIVGDVSFPITENSVIIPEIEEKHLLEVVK